MVAQDAEAKDGDAEEVAPEVRPPKCELGQELVAVLCVGAGASR